MRNTGLGKLTKEQEEIFAALTQKLIKAIEGGGDLPWRNPVRSGSQDVPPTNFVSQVPYTGINLVILTAARKVNPYWLTFQQISDLSGMIKKGTHGERIVYYTRTYHGKNGKKIPESEAEAKPREDYFVKKVIKNYTVYNLEDVTGIDYELPGDNPRSDNEAIEAAEKVIANMPDPPRISIIDKGFTPHFNPTDDIVRMPSRAYMETDQEYYSVFFHELIHSTLMPNRTDRGRYYKKRNQETNAFEELIAELGAVFLCAETGILFRTYNNSLSYLKGWRKVLVQVMKKDLQFVEKAATAAQHAVDFMLTGDIPNYDDDDKPEPHPQPEPQSQPEPRDDDQPEEPPLKWALVKETNWKGRYVQILQRNDMGNEVIWAEEKGYLMSSELVFQPEHALPKPYYPLNTAVFRKDKEDFKVHLVAKYAHHEDPQEFMYLCIRDGDGGYWLSRRQIDSREDIKTMLLLRKRKRERENEPKPDGNKYKIGDLVQLNDGEWWGGYVADKHNNAYRVANGDHAHWFDESKLEEWDGKTKENKSGLVQGMIVKYPIGNKPPYLEHRYAVVTGDKLLAKGRIEVKTAVERKGNIDIGYKTLFAYRFVKNYREFNCFRLFLNDKVRVTAGETKDQEGTIAESFVRNATGEKFHQVLISQNLYFINEEHLDHY